MIPLTDRRACSPEVAGGKGAGLARLVKLGCPAPQGFVISVLGFRRYLDHNQIDFPVRSAFDANRVNSIRTEILNGQLPPDLAQAAQKGLADLTMPVAVRSSMVGEDSIQTSCAGQLDTFLDIQSDSELFDAIKKCYASVLNDRLLVYLDRIGGDGARIQPALAIIVQQMIVAKSSGVAFSADPVTGQSGVLIEAVCGPSRELVEGRVDPDRYRIDTRGVICEYSVQTQGKPVLSKAEIAGIGTYVRMLGDKLRFPVDVEWAVDHNGLHLLQMRAVTTLINRHIYCNRLVSDMIPGLIKPLLWSTNIRSMAVNVFGRLFTRLIGANDYDFSRLTRRICSRAYTDMTLLGELLEKVGLPHNFMGMIAREEKPSGIPFWFSPRLLLKSLTSLPFLLKLSFSRREMKHFIAAHTAKLARLRQSDWFSCDESELLHEIHYLTNIHGLTQWYVVLAGMNMMIRNKLLAKFVTSHTPAVTGQQLLKGLVGLKSLEPNQRLKAMAVKVRRLPPAALTTMERGDPGDIRSTLAGTPEGDELLDDMERFMEKYGFLSSSGTDFSVTPWCEDASFVWKSIVRLAGGVPESDLGVTRSERLDHIVAVSEQLSWLKRIRFRRMLTRTTEYIDMREKISMLMSKDAYQMRRLSLAIADKFIERGILKARDEVFFLYIDEIEALVAHRLDEAEARSRISLRISDMDADAEIEPSDTICGDQITYKTVDTLQNQNYLVGICGSPGKVTGRARIVRDPRNSPGDFGESDILVVPFTDAGWTPLFTAVAGVVAETGGILSHTAIVAREYRLPAIVNVKNATVVIKDNQIITLDAQGGRVYLK